jgi:dienelactone hydrolase
VYHFAVRSQWRCFVLGLLALLAAAPSGHAQRYVEREVRIPWVQAGVNGLDALLVYVDLPGKHPLALLTHGSSRDPQEQARITPWQELPQALWFARRGFVALVLVRRGYGTSGGEKDMHRCPRCMEIDPGESAQNAAQDLRLAIDYARGLPQVDAMHTVAVGVSTGGLATVALTATNPPGLMAGINFAGGTGSRADHDVPNAGELIGAYRDFGRTARVPMLWIYAENDKYFWPELAQKFDEAFRSKGGVNQFVLAPAIGADGHSLFRHVDAWSATVDGFLKAQNLEPLPELLPEIKPANVPPPAGLSETGLEAFQGYLFLGSHRAFAKSEHFFGFSVARMTVDEAKQNALERCQQSAQKKESCTVVYIDDTPIHP